jgi:selenocysteine-specific elongation factor
LKLRTRAHFHAYAMEAVVDVKLHDQSQLAPGATAFASITLPEPALLLPGDRFILRQFSPVITIGGGVVLDAAPLRVGAKSKTEKKAAASAVLLQSMKIFESFERRGAILTLRVTRRARRGLTLSEAVAETGWRQEEIVELAEALVREQLLIRLQDTLFAAHELSLAEQNLLDAISNFHEKDPLKPGMAKGELQDESTRFGMAPELFDAALSSLTSKKQIEFVGDLVRLPGRGAQMKDEEAESKKQIEDAFAGAGLKVPTLYEVLAGLKIDKTRAQKIVTLLLRDKILIKVSSELVFHQSALDRLRALIAAQKAKSPKIDVAIFKEMTGVSRKYAIPLLEYLDRERITRRVGDERVIL